VEQRSDSAKLSDLKNPGRSADGDIVMFIYRDDVYDEASERKNVAELIIAKHRNGPTGTVELYFQRNLTQFRNALKRDVAL
jgi:replicative DNA helicase